MLRQTAPKRHTQKLQRLVVMQMRKAPANDRAVGQTVTISWFNMKCCIHCQLNMRLVYHMEISQ